MELDFRHGFWHEDRERVKQAFVANETTASRQTRFCECGSAARVLVSDDGKEAKVVSSQCHDRVCRACGNERQRVVTENLLNYCEGKELRFLTLTLKHNTEPLADQIDRLYTCFSRLRERNAWKCRVKGGAAFFETKPAKDKDEWHPHLHIILESDFFPHAILKSEWLICTGDSSVVHIEYVHDPLKQISYVAKYASKPIDATVYERPNMLREAIKALEGRRACMVIGNWRRTKKNPEGLNLLEKPKDKGIWIDIGSIGEVAERAQAGEPQAVALCERLGIGTHYTKRQSTGPPEQNPHELPF